MSEIKELNKVELMEKEKLIKLLGKKPKVIVAEGAASGHSHAFYEADKVDFNGKILNIKEETALEHEEHTKHVFKPGMGEVTIQREYQMGSLRRVAD